MKNIGYTILVLIYLISFSIVKEIISGVDTSSIEAKTNNQSLIKSLANDLYDTIGMDDFFDSLSVGL